MKSFLKKIGVYLLLVGLVFALQKVILPSVFEEGGGLSSFLYGMLDFASIILAIIPAVIVQTVVHEGGHLVFGLCSGYRFLSFRVGSLMLVKKPEGLRFYTFSLAGTGGQCLMAPPPLKKDGTYPVLWYNLGGVIFNLILAGGALFTLLYATLPDFLTSFCIGLIAFGAFIFITNGIPFKLGMIPNDGYNALMLTKDKNALKGLWIQLAVTEKQTAGVRLGDMPDNWFELPDDADRHNVLVSTVEVFKENRLMDMGRLDEARTQIEKCLGNGMTLVPLYVALLKMDRMTIDLIERGEDADTQDIADKTVGAVEKSMPDFPSVLRFDYVYTLIKEKNVSKSEQIFARFDKMSTTYPYEKDIEGERELMELANSKVN